MSDKTNTLTKILQEGGPERLDRYLAEEEANFFDSKNAFGTWLKETILSKGMSQQDLFVGADIPERYGYKLLSGEKHTAKRDVILRLLISASLSVREVDRGLKLYGFSPLYARVPRDAVLIIGINEGKDVYMMNAFLKERGMRELEPCGEPLEKSKE